MDDDRAELGVLLDLALPVHEHAVRGDHEEVALPLCGQVTHRGKHLDGLTQAHVIAKEHALLTYHVLGAEDLVLAQVGRHQAQVQLGRLDRIGDLRWQAAPQVRGRQGSLGYHAGWQGAFQQRDEAGGVVAITTPDRLRGEA